MANTESWSRCLISVLIVAAPALATFSAQSHLDAQVRAVNRTYARSSVHTTNVNRNVNVNVHGGYGYGYDRWGHPVARAAAATATAVAVGTMVASLPPRCTVTVVGAVSYQNCGGVYYQPVYHGSTVQYIVVNQP